MQPHKQKTGESCVAQIRPTKMSQCMAASASLQRCFGLLIHSTSRNPMQLQTPHAYPTTPKTDIHSCTPSLMSHLDVCAARGAWRRRQQAVKSISPLRGSVWQGSAITHWEPVRCACHPSQTPRNTVLWWTDWNLQVFVETKNVHIGDSMT